MTWDDDEEEDMKDAFKAGQEKYDHYGEEYHAIGTKKPWSLKQLEGAFHDLATMYVIYIDMGDCDGLHFEMSKKFKNLEDYLLEHLDANWDLRITQQINIVTVELV